MKHLFTIVVAMVLLAAPWSASALTEDGKAVVKLSNDEYSRIVERTPVVSDKKLGQYVTGIVKKLGQQGPKLPGSVSLRVTILDKDIPEVYSMANGNLMVTKSAIMAMENEAQLAALLSHEAAHITGSHYPGIYEAFKAKEKKARAGALASGLAGVVMGAAIDYTVQTRTDDIYADLSEGDISYREAMKKTTAIAASAGVLEGFSDIYDSLPPETKAGNGDPRIPLEMVADAEGLKLLAKAGYDTGEAGEAWRRLRKAQDKAKEGSTEAMAMAFLPPQFRALMGGVEGPAGIVRPESLVRTMSQNPPDRPQLLDALAGSKEITAIKSGSPVVGGSFEKIVGAFVMGDASTAFEEGDYAASKRLFQSAWDSGYKTADVAYKLGRSQVGEFAFAASDKEKEASEEYLLKAIELDPKMPEPYKALGELYGEWEMYGESAKMYKKYLKAAPKASDKSRIERKIQKMERKASR
jgi:tetratricopeptide (TPR) repeat protein